MGIDGVKLTVRFYRTATGSEPVLDWLREQSLEIRKSVGHWVCRWCAKWPLIFGRFAADFLRELPEYCLPWCGLRWFCSTALLKNPRLPPYPIWPWPENAIPSF